MAESPVHQASTSSFNRLRKPSLPLAWQAQTEMAQSMATGSLTVRSFSSARPFPEPSTSPQKSLDSAVTTAQEPGSHVEPEPDDVATLDGVFFACDAEVAGVAGFGAGGVSFAAR
jgi:hypothetical protein